MRSMMRWIWGLVIAALFGTGCATVHSGNFAVGTDLPIKISAEVENNQAHDSFSLIHLTFENQASEWVRIENAEVVISEEGQKTIRFIAGNDLRDWAEAYQAKLKLEKHNRQVAVGLISAAALIPILASGRSGSGVASGLAGAGAATFVGAQAYEGGHEIKESIEKVENPDWTPETYIDRPFTLPGQLYLRRWLLLSKPAGQAVDKLALTLRAQDGRQETFVIPLHVRVR